MKLFLDTNILIDKLANRQPFVDEVKQLCIAKYFGDVSLHVSTQSYLDTMFVLRKFAPEKELRRRAIASLNFFDVVDVEKQNLVPALQSDWSDVEDFMIAKTAEDNNANFLLTRDVQGFKNSKVKVMTPKDFLKFLKDEYSVEYGIG